MRKIVEPSVRLAPTAHPTTLDIAWAAGIHEGEGWCGRTSANRKTGKTSTTETINIAQKDHWLLFRLKALFGGSIVSHSNEGVKIW